MIKPRDFSIKSKLQVILTITCGFALLIACVILIVYELVHFKISLKNELTVLAKMVADRTTATVLFDDPETAVETLGALQAKRCILESRIVTPDGHEFAVFHRFTASETHLRFPHHKYNGQAGSRFGSLSVFSDHLFVSQPMMIENKQIATVEIIADLQDMTALLLRYLIVLGVVILAALGLALLLLGGLQKQITAPILNLARVAEAFSKETDYSVRAAKSGNDELGVLVDAFNHMLDLINQREKELKESEKKYRGIFENAVEGMFQSSMDGRIISANPSMAAIFGYSSPEDMINSITNIAMQCYAQPQKREEFKSQLGQKTRLAGYEIQFIRKDGSLFWGAMTVRTVKPANGTTHSYEGSIVDITERKEKEKAEREKHLAETATRLKSEFLANMSHEIRTPMSGVISASELALALKPPPELDKYLRIIHSSGHSLLGVINDILDFSKIEAGKLDLESAPFILDDLFLRVSDIFLSKAVKKGIDLIYNSTPDTPVALIGDAMRLQQVITNLVANAIKFTEKDGIITVGVSAGKMPAASPGKARLHFFVSDTGVGMQPEFLDRLFTAFTQEDASTTRKYGGSGLGLTISKQLVEMMQGQIHAESEVGKGTTFHFNILIGLQPPNEQEALKMPGDLLGLKALVIDERGIHGDVLQTCLNSFGLKAEIVSSDREASDLLQKNRETKEACHLLIIEHTGNHQEHHYMHSARIKQIRRDFGPDIPIIMLTAINDVPAKNSNNGINAYLIKPVSRPLLFEAVMEAFGKEIRDQDRLTPSGIDFADVSSFKQRLTGFKTLLVEDNPINQELARAFLTKVGIETIIAENGKKALEYLKQNTFDAILMDIQMPEMDGYQATRAIRQDPDFDTLPIIAMTAHAMQGDEAKCREAGMDDYVTKPIDRFRLYRTLWKYLKTKR